MGINPTILFAGYTRVIIEESRLHIQRCPSGLKGEVCKNMSVGTEATQTKELWTGRGKDVRHEAADFDAPRNKKTERKKKHIGAFIKKNRFAYFVEQVNGKTRSGHTSTSKTVRSTLFLSQLNCCKGLVDMLAVLRQRNNVMRPQMQASIC